MKKKNKSEREIKIKKQLIGTGVYIALVAAVVGITSNSVKKILGGADGYEIPNLDNNANKIVIPELDENHFELPSQTEFVFPDTSEFESVSENPEGVTAEVNETPTDVTENVETSGEPENSDQFALDNLNNENVPPSVFVKPVSGYISREFSGDELLYTPTMNDFRTHNGVDIAGDVGTGVVSFADGVIADIYDDAFMGKTVVISHSGKLVSCYSNLSPDLPKEIVVGATVTVGQVIGGIGESAIIESADVPHLHFELYKDEICVNPEEYIPQ